MSRDIIIRLPNAVSIRRALETLVASARDERDYFDGGGGAHGARAEAFERIAITIENALVVSMPSPDVET